MIKYERVITDQEQLILENDLLDITDWINKAIEGKINNCAKRLARAEHDRLAKEGADMIPAKISSLCNSAFNCKTYKNRKERDKEAGLI